MHWNILSMPPYGPLQYNGNRHSSTNLFTRIGYQPDKHIVAYDDEGGGWAGRFIWTLDVITHTRSSYLNGGLIAWAAARLPLTEIVPVVEPTVVNLTINTDVIAEKEDVLASI